MIEAVNPVISTAETFSTAVRAGPQLRVRYYSGHMPTPLQAKTLTAAVAFENARETIAQVASRDMAEVRHNMPPHTFAFTFLVEQPLRKLFRRSALHLHQDGPAYLIGEYLDGEFTDGLDRVRSSLGLMIYVQEGDVILSPQFKQLYPPVARLQSASPEPETPAIETAPQPGA